MPNTDFTEIKLNKKEKKKIENLYNEKNICLYIINIVDNYFNSNLVNSSTATDAGL